MELGLRLDTSDLDHRAQQQGQRKWEERFLPLVLVFISMNFKGSAHRNHHSPQTPDITHHQTNPLPTSHPNHCKSWMQQKEQRREKQTPNHLMAMCVVCALFQAIGFKVDPETSLFYMLIVMNHSFKTLLLDSSLSHKKDGEQT